MKQAGGRLLVVDDDPDVRESLERALRHAGFAVTTAGHGADALASLARSPVDLIVLDVLMPMLDGFDACRRLRQRGDATPVLVLTAKDAVDDRVTGLEAGADDYLVKPFALRELQARLRALLRRAGDGTGEGECAQRLGAVGRRGHGVARVAQGPVQRVAQVTVVIHDQEPGLHRDE